MDEEVILGQSEEERQRTRELRREKRKGELLELKKKYLPLLKFLKSNGLKFKTAAVKKNTVEYFRMDHFRGFLEEKTEKIELNATVKQLLADWEKIFIYYDRIEGQPQLKWPQELENSAEGPDSKFASFPFDSAESSKTMTVLIVVCIFGMVLFPLWPYELKYVLWLVSLWTTLLFVGVIVVRLFTYLLGAILGGSFWIFPRLLDNCGFLESLVPIYSWVWWTGSTIYSVIVRVTVLSLFIYYGYHIYNDPTIIECTPPLLREHQDHADHHRRHQRLGRGQDEGREELLPERPHRLQQTPQQHRGGRPGTTGRGGRVSISRRAVRRFLISAVSIVIIQ